MAQYTKHNSNYIKINRHQNLKDGSTIFEKDWVTIGGRLHFGSGKVPYYNNGNFIFTTSPTPFYQKKYKNGVVVGTWTYDDVKDATSDINQIKSDEYSEDIRTYAYYGSCVELVRSSVENIINTFPGKISVSEEQLHLYNEENDSYTTFSDYFVLQNPFEIHTYLQDVTLNQYDNEMRYLSYSWKNYEISFDGGTTFSDITQYDITVRSLYERKNGDDIEFEMFSNEEFFKAETDWKKSNCRLRYWLPENKTVYSVKINNQEVIKGYIFEGELVALVPKMYKNMVIKPKDEFIEEYFNNISGFEKQLLNRASTPLYSNLFVTPIEYSLGYFYYKRTYTWPSDDYCIDITSTKYFEFLDKITKMAELLDELWTDNLWRKMTHEAIKNYDWTYSREFNAGDEDDNIDGGERMHKVINIIGRVFDDVKRNIDVIRKNNRTTYNADRNIPNALLSDKLEINGWNIYSTISTYTDEDGKELPSNEIKLDDDFLTTAKNSKFIVPKFGKTKAWYGTNNNNDLSFSDVDISFMRKLLLSSKYILKTKGTRNSIDMVMGMFGYGACDYEVTEEYRTVVPKPYDDSKYSEEESFGDKIVRLNSAKDKDRIYDDDVSGIPVGSFTLQTNIDDIIYHTTYLIPFYNQSRVYDGEFTFQSKGGWGYNMKSDKNINEFGWTETLSYLHVVSTIEDLLAVNTNTVGNGDIYYVANINDYSNYTETDTLYSNFFVLVDDYAVDLFSSWKNLDLTGNIYTTSNGYTDDEVKMYKNYAEKAVYLNNIVPNNIGNNPHVGYGKYDKGDEYYEYLKQPFKYAIDRHLFDYAEEEEAKDVTFNISDPIKTMDWGKKLGICTAEDDEEKITEEKVKILTKYSERSTVSQYGGKREVTYSEPDFDSTEKQKKDTYYLNSKVIYFRNKIDDKGGQYKKYFKNVIVKYLLQVIPSTAILILEGFE